LTSLAKSNTVFVIGGATLFEQLMPDINILYLTRIAGNYDCDTFLPMEKILSQFELINSIEIDRATRFETYITRQIYDLPIRTEL
jgi:dihydrofolate reductase